MTFVAVMLLAASGCGDRPSSSTTAAPQHSDEPIDPPPPPPSAAAPPVPPAPTVALYPRDAAEAKAVLDPLQGTWKIESSRSLGGGGGSVFYPNRGKLVSFRENILTMPGDTPGWETRKTIGVVKRAGSANGSVVEIEHRGDFKTSDEFDADPKEIGRLSKGWDRHALLRVESDTMTLSVVFPQYDAPTDFEPTDRGEVVVLKRQAPAQ
ncbi:MAG: hypothetical protein HOV80_04345 [Polyangiaceae bacterium]|nr:hypothetical protein [Polyangiaceae bacterium]